MVCLEVTMKTKTKKNNLLEMDVIYQLTLLLQLSLMVFILTFAVMSCFVAEFFVCFEALVAIMMFILAYNNQKIYKRKYMTWVYLMFGIVILATLWFV